MTTRVTDIHRSPDTHTNRPTATSVPAGTLYPCSTHNLVYRSDGTTWATWAALIPTGGTSAQVLTKNSGTDYDVSWAAASGGGGGGGLLAVGEYNPGTETNATPGTSDGDLWSGGLTASFTVPSSGKVLVRLSTFIYVNTTFTDMSALIREGTTTVARKRVCNQMDGGDLLIQVAVPFYITGLTAGASKTYKVGGVQASGGANGFIAGGASTGTTVGAATLEVWSA